MSIATATKPAADLRATGPLDADQVRAYVRDGFHLQQQVFDADTLHAWRNELRATIKRGTDAGNFGAVDIDQGNELCIHFPHRASQLLTDAVIHPALGAILAQLAGAHLPAGWWDGSVKCMQSMYFLKGPGMPGQAWHQDEIYIPTRDRSLIGAWIAMEDADESNGCLWVLPGSHAPGVLYPQRAHGNPAEWDVSEESHGFDDSAAIPVPVTAGSVLFFNGYLLHRSLRNRSTRSREALVGHYCSSQTLLPWLGAEDQIKQGKARIATADTRAVIPVTGQDPHAWKGYDQPTHFHGRGFGKG